MVFIFLLNSNEIGKGVPNGILPPPPRRHRHATTMVENHKKTFNTKITSFTKLSSMTKLKQPINFIQLILLDGCLTFKRASLTQLLACCSFLSNVQTRISSYHTVTQLPTCCENQTSHFQFSKFLKNLGIRTLCIIKFNIRCLSTTLISIIQNKLRKEAP